ncbi:hypothetical protein PR202_ga15336 [Eleusine coracana subsp. coracana]|uniref:Uncharacterized protein n=1 Tax=Eleusine coracana subsp. coracana TaxID=191504 RepID=A0AAV5CIQ8_ELECO|nr:hypothetical protein PR202_ga15336 [Eleusine coracana subsp. coracana]
MTRTLHPVARSGAGLVNPEMHPEEVPAAGTKGTSREQIQEEVLDLKSCVGNIEHHLSNMQGQLDSI